jgi:hypothetical protein
MTNEEVFSLFEKNLDNIAKAFDEFYSAYNALPKYLRNEILHPKKKPRGSIRRARQGRLSE